MASESDLSREVRPKLPLWKMVGKSYSVFFNNIGAALRGTWLWLLVIGGLTAAIGYVQFDALRAFLETQPSPGKMPGLSAKIQIFSLTMNAIMLLGGASCAVMWHRFLLLKEQPGLSGSNVTSGYVWHYVLTLILIGLIAILVGLLFGAGVVVLTALGQGETHSPATLAAALGMVVLWLGLELLVIRLMLLLPARAIGDNTLTFRQTWATTKGNSWRLFWGCFLTLIPPLALLQIPFGHSLLSKLVPTLGQPFRLSPDTLAEVVVFQTFAAVFGAFAGLIMVGFLSFSYLYFLGVSELGSRSEQ